MEIEVCQNCNRPFSIVEFGSSGNAGPRDREPIDCPHCKTVWSYRRSAGVFVTAALTPEQEQKQDPRPKEDSQKIGPPPSATKAATI
jgi:hypothetical protein